MARIKDFAKDLGLDIKEAIELAAGYGLGTKQVSGNIDDAEIAIFLNKLTLSKQFSGIDAYFNGEATIKSAKKKAKKVEPKIEPVEVKEEPKAEAKIEKPVKAEKPAPKAEAPKAETKPAPKADTPKAEAKPAPKADAPKAEAKPAPKAEKPFEKKFENKDFKGEKNDKFNRDNKKPFEKPQGGTPSKESSFIKSFDKGERIGKDGFTSTNDNRNDNNKKRKT